MLRSHEVRGRGRGVLHQDRRHSPDMARQRRYVCTLTASRQRQPRGPQSLHLTVGHSLAPSSQQWPPVPRPLRLTAVLVPPQRGYRRPVWTTAANPRAPPLAPHQRACTRKARTPLTRLTVAGTTRAAEALVLNAHAGTVRSPALHAPASDALDAARASGGPGSALA